jgi:hypothetical protein
VKAAFQGATLDIIGLQSRLGRDLQRMQEYPEFSFIVSRAKLVGRYRMPVAYQDRNSIRRRWKVDIDRDQATCAGFRPFGMRRGISRSIERYHVWG